MYYTYYAYILCVFYVLSYMLCVLHLLCVRIICIIRIIVHIVHIIRMIVDIVCIIRIICTYNVYFWYYIRHVVCLYVSHVHNYYAHFEYYRACQCLYILCVHVNLCIFLTLSYMSCELSYMHTVHIIRIIVDIHMNYM